MSECLIFDLMGDLGHFKKFYTTASPLTFDIPPKTVLTGIIGAILGLDYKKRYELFDAKIALKVNHKPRKIFFGINWLNTKWRGSDISSNMKKWFNTILNGVSLSKTELKTICAFTGLEWVGQSPHTQPSIEFLLEPSYRVYYSSDNPYFDELYEMVSNHKSIYPVYFGISELLSNFEFVDLISQTEEKNNDFVQINTIVPEDAVLSNIQDFIRLKSGIVLEIENIPVKMIPQRKVIQYSNVYYSLDGKPIEFKVKKYYHIYSPNSKIDENIIYF